MKDKKNKTPWPTKDVMEQIYNQKLWGGFDNDFYSGEGSHLPEITQPYLNSLKIFLKSFDEPLTICDLGCGDFNIGKELFNYSKKYIAIDIVRDLINRNEQLFQFENLEFLCLDISKDDLPYGDCVILRQVLQHLSNNEIQLILNKLKRFKYIILTEHLPNGEFIPNLDKIASQGIRIKNNSGVIITSPPFNFRVKNEKILNELKLDYDKGKIVTYLFEL